MVPRYVSKPGGSVERRIVVVVALVAVLCVASAGVASAATTRYANPSGSGTVCSLQTPCGIVNAVDLAVDDDTVIVEPGTYPVPSPGFFSSAKITIRGQGTARPKITMAGALAFGIDISNAASTIDNLEIDATEPGVPLAFSGSQVSNVVVKNIRPSGSLETCRFDGAAVTITSTVCWAQSPDGGEALSLSDLGVATTSTLRNVTAIGTQLGMYASAKSGVTRNVTIVNSIIRGGSSAYFVGTGSGGGTLNISESHTDRNGTSTFGLGATFTDAGGNQTAAPLFVDAAHGDFHEAVGSPTIDAGFDDAANGTLDIDGQARKLGVHTDLGADEFRADASPVTGAASAVAQTTAVLAATVNPHGVPAVVSFQYGPSTAYGGTSTATAAGSGTVAKPVGTSLTGLAPGTTYHYRLIATNAFGSTFGADRTFRTAAVPALSKLRISPRSFTPARSGASTARKPGTVVSFTLSLGARVTFMAQHLVTGRRGAHGKCVARTHRNRKKKRCTRILSVSGSFSVTGVPGSNRLRFTGRLKHHALAAGRYRLFATPRAGGTTGKTARASFTVHR